MYTPAPSPLTDRIAILKDQIEADDFTIDEVLEAISDLEDALSALSAKYLRVEVAGLSLAATVDHVRPNMTGTAGDLLDVALTRWRGAFRG